MCDSQDRRVTTRCCTELNREAYDQLVSARHASSQSARDGDVVTKECICSGEFVECEDTGGDIDWCARVAGYML